MRMNIGDLPLGSNPKPVKSIVFPTRWQAVLWRNWGIVPVEKLAKILQCSVRNLSDAALELGLPPHPQADAFWLKSCYLTVIRNNWHLLPYSQLLEILDWSPEQMAYTLKEEDFCWGKLGGLKPDCETVVFRELTPEENSKTARLKALLKRYFSSDEMTYEEQPLTFLKNFGPVKPVQRKELFEFNFIHSYCASCGDVIGNSDTVDPVPENLLAQYASLGIQGIWMHALLHLLVPIPGAEEFSSNCEERLEKLQKIVNRCKKYGIKVYLYLNEPRCMKPEFYKKMPHWAGYQTERQGTTICTTGTPEVLNYLENSMKTIFGKVRDLGGAFCITMSENLTNCHSMFRHDLCPSCKNVPPAKIIADIVNAMGRGMHASAPEAKMIAYDWAWCRTFLGKDKIQFKHEVLDLLDKDIYLLSVSEWGKITKIGGVESYLKDYSISQPGPSEETLAVWEHAKKLGIKIIAKVQINNSWELSSVPSIPVPYLIREHLDNLKKAGVTGLMLSWTQGGFPGGNLELLRAIPEEIAAAKFTQETAEKICQAWKFFSDAFREFPFDGSHVAYTAPMNVGPQNLLYPEKTGYRATMIGFPYDDLAFWRGPYPEDVFEDQFRKICSGWEKGLKILKEIEPQILPAEKAEFQEICVLAEASYCHLYSTLQQIRFIRIRDNEKGKTGLAECAEKELQTALVLHNIVRKDSRIGFEASNHYYYTLNDLKEKVICCAIILEQLANQ